MKPTAALVWLLLPLLLAGAASGSSELDAELVSRAEADTPEYAESAEPSEPAEPSSLAAEPEPTSTELKPAESSKL